MINDLIHVWDGSQGALWFDFLYQHLIQDAKRVICSLVVGLKIHFYNYMTFARKNVIFGRAGSGELEPPPPSFQNIIGKKE